MAYKGIVTAIAAVLIAAVSQVQFSAGLVAVSSQRLGEIRVGFDGPPGAFAGKCQNSACNTCQENFLLEDGTAFTGYCNSVFAVKMCVYEPSQTCASNGVLQSCNEKYECDSCDPPTGCTKIVGSSCKTKQC